jgi:hypothetical protein
MRPILIERARRRMLEKHGGGLRKVNLENLELAVTVDDPKIGCTYGDAFFCLLHA